MSLLLGLLYLESLNEPSLLALISVQFFIIVVFISFMMFMIEVIHIICHYRTVGRWWPFDGEKWQ